MKYINLFLTVYLCVMTAACSRSPDCGSDASQKFAQETAVKLRNTTANALFRDLVSETIYDQTFCVKVDNEIQQVGNMLGMSKSSISDVRRIAEGKRKIYDCNSMFDGDAALEASSKKLQEDAKYVVDMYDNAINVKYSVDDLVTMDKNEDRTVQICQATVSLAGKTPNFSGSYKIYYRLLRGSKDKLSFEYIKNEFFPPSGY
jgi:hypothetical protein